METRGGSARRPLMPKTSRRRITRKQKIEILRRRLVFEVAARIIQRAVRRSGLLDHGFVKV